MAFQYYDALTGWCVTVGVIDANDLTTNTQAQKVYRFPTKATACTFATEVLKGEAEDLNTDKFYVGKEVNYVNCWQLGVRTK